MEKTNNIIPMIVHISLGLIFCILLGIVFHGTEIFNVGVAQFQIIVSGITGATFYSLLKYRGIKSAISFHGILFIAFLFISQVDRFTLVIPHFLLFASIGISIFVYERYIVRTFPSFKFGKFIFLAVIYLVCFSALTLVYGLIIKIPNLMYPLKVQFDIWILVAIGLGLGLEIAELKYKAGKEKVGS